MTPSLKLLHDAMLIVTRDLARAENDLKLTLTDAKDSEENFNRRLANLEQQQDKIQSQQDVLQKNFEQLETERHRMIAARAEGGQMLRQKIAKLNLNKMTVQLAILQAEVNAII
jgi:predicted  nucleic acid-binding Zn-ribbon protein